MNGLRIPDTPIAVDFWKIRKCLGIHLFFLSHAHADHTCGLTSTWSHPFYTSPLTKKLVIHKLKVREELVKELELNQRYVIPLDDTGQVMMNVTLIDANHCPGAVMFVFEGYFGRILYTGDFRYSPSMFSDTILRNQPSLDVLYLDDTYIHKHDSFPGRGECIKEIIDIMNRHPTCHVYIGMRTLGKESLLVRLAYHFNTLVSVSEEMFNIVKLLELPDVFTLEQNMGFIHAVPVKSLSKSGRSRILYQRNSQAIFIEPSALLTSRTQESGGIWRVPYSDHSSYAELHKFVAALRPRRVRTIVNPVSSTPMFDYCLDQAPAAGYVVPPSVSAIMRQAPRFTASKAAVNNMNKERRRRMMGTIAMKHKSSRSLGVEYQVPETAPAECSIRTLSADQQNSCSISGGQNVFENGVGLDGSVKPGAGGNHLREQSQHSSVCSQAAGHPAQTGSGISHGKTSFCPTSVGQNVPIQEISSSSQTGSPNIPYVYSNTCVYPLMPPSSQYLVHNTAANQVQSVVQFKNSQLYPYSALYLGHFGNGPHHPAQFSGEAPVIGGGFVPVHKRNSQMGMTMSTVSREQNLSHTELASTNSQSAGPAVSQYLISPQFHPDARQTAASSPQAESAQRQMKDLLSSNKNPKPSTRAENCVPEQVPYSNRSRPDWYSVKYYTRPFTCVRTSETAISPIDSRVDHMHLQDPKIEPDSVKAINICPIKTEANVDAGSKQQRNTDLTVTNAESVSEISDDANPSSVIRPDLQVTRFWAVSPGIQSCSSIVSTTVRDQNHDRSELSPAALLRPSSQANNAEVGTPHPGSDTCSSSTQQQAMETPEISNSEASQCELRSQSEHGESPVNQETSSVQAHDDEQLVLGSWYNFHEYVCDSLDPVGRNPQGSSAVTSQQQCHDITAQVEKPDDSLTSEVLNQCDKGSRVSHCEVLEPPAHSVQSSIENHVLRAPSAISASQTPIDDSNANSCNVMQTPVECLLSSSNGALSETVSLQPIATSSAEPKDTVETDRVEQTSSGVHSADSPHSSPIVSAEICEFRILATSSATEAVEDVTTMRNVPSEKPDESLTSEVLNQCDKGSRVSHCGVLEQPAHSVQSSIENHVLQAPSAISASQTPIDDSNANSCNVMQTPVECLLSSRNGALSKTLSSQPVATSSAGPEDTVLTDRVEQTNSGVHSADSPDSSPIVSAEIHEFHILATSSTTEVVEDVSKMRNVPSEKPDESLTSEVLNQRDKGSWDSHCGVLEQPAHSVQSSIENHVLQAPSAISATQTPIDDSNTNSCNVMQTPMECLLASRNGALSKTVSLQPVATSSAGPEDTVETDSGEQTSHIVHSTDSANASPIVSAEIHEFRILATSSTTEVVEDVTKMRNSRIAVSVPADDPSSVSFEADSSPSVLRPASCEDAMSPSREQMKKHSHSTSPMEASQDGHTHESCTIDLNTEVVVSMDKVNEKQLSCPSKDLMKLHLGRRLEHSDVTCDVAPVMLTPELFSDDSEQVVDETCEEQSCSESINKETAVERLTDGNDEPPLKRARMIISTGEGDDIAPTATISMIQAPKSCQENITPDKSGDEIGVELCKNVPKCSEMIEDHSRCRTNPRLPLIYLGRNKRNRRQAHVSNPSEYSCQQTLSKSPQQYGKEKGKVITKKCEPVGQKGLCDFELSVLPVKLLMDEAKQSADMDTSRVDTLCVQVHMNWHKSMKPKWLKNLRQAVWF